MPSPGESTRDQENTELLHTCREIRDVTCGDRFNHQPKADDIAELIDLLKASPTKLAHGTVKFADLAVIRRTGSDVRFTFGVSAPADFADRLCYSGSDLAP